MARGRAPQEKGGEERQGEEQKEVVEHHGQGVAQRRVRELLHQQVVQALRAHEVAEVEGHLAQEPPRVLQDVAGGEGEGGPTVVLRRGLCLGGPGAGARASRRRRAPASCRTRGCRSRRSRWARCRRASGCGPTRRGARPGRRPGGGRRVLGGGAGERRWSPVPGREREDLRGTGARGRPGARRPRRPIGSAPTTRGEGPRQT